MPLHQTLLDYVRAQRARGIDGLLLAGWGGSLAIVFGLFVALWFSFGFWWVYWRSADMDTWMVYEAFLRTDGLPQTYFDHPGYLTILLLGYWFKLMHAIGFLPAHALSALPPESDIAASAAAWMRATQAARLLSLGAALIFLGDFVLLMRRWLKDWRIALLATYALAFSGGMMMEARIVRTELIAAGFAYLALLVLLAGAERGANRRVLAVFVAALFGALAMLNKIQVIFPLLTFPVIVFAFMNPPTQDERARPWGALIVAFIAAAVLTLFALPLLQAGLFDAGAVARRTALFHTGLPVYQMIIAAWFVLWIFIVAWRFRLDAVETLAALAALVAGSALGVLALMLHNDPGNAVAAMNPFESMLNYAAASDPSLHAGGSLGTPMLRALVSGLALMLARLTFVLSSSPRPTIFLEWAVFAMMVFAWKRGERKAVWQAALLLVAAHAIDWPATLRGLKTEYFILADPLIIMAAAWLLVRVPALQTHRLAYPVGAAVIAVTFAVGLAEPVKHSLKKDVPIDFCTPHNPRTGRIGRLSFCP